MSFGPGDLRALDRLLAEADWVVPMQDIYEGAKGEGVIGMRHDVDDNPDSLKTAVKLAAWEEERGYRSTYFILHGASYFDSAELGGALAMIADSGHEIGIHANAIAAALRVGGDPDEILNEGLERLRSYGHAVYGVAAHGDELCNLCGFVNDEQFVECARPEMGKSDRYVTFGEERIKLAPRPLADFGLLYDTHRLPHGRYLSDSGGHWNEPFPGKGEGQLHILMHPDWYRDAFPVPAKVAA